MFKNIQPDKWRHFETGILMGLILQFASWKLLDERLWQSIIITLIAIMAISYGFELFSKITRLGKYDLMDAVASAIGGIVGIALALPFQC